MQIPRHQVAIPAAADERRGTPEEQSSRRRRELFAWARKHFPAHIGAAASVAPRLTRQLGRTPTPEEVRQDPAFRRMVAISERHYPAGAGRGGGCESAALPAAPSPGAAAPTHSERAGSPSPPGCPAPRPQEVAR